MCSVFSPVVSAFHLDSLFPRSIRCFKQVKSNSMLSSVPAAKLKGSLLDSSDSGCPAGRAAACEGSAQGSAQGSPLCPRL